VATKAQTARKTIARPSAKSNSVRSIESLSASGSTSDNRVSPTPMIRIATTAETPIGMTAGASNHRLT
jgi:hypothetical protein